MIWNVTGLAIGFVSLAIAVMAEVRAVRVRRALSTELSNIREANLEIIRIAYDKDCAPEERLVRIQTLADSQKREIHGLFGSSLIPYVNVWDLPPGTGEKQ